MNKFSAFLVALLVAGSIPAHAGVFGSEDSASAVEKGGARTMNKVAKGVILQVSEAKIEEANGTAGKGALGGAAIGAAAGMNNHGIVGGAIGAVVGGVGGAAVAAFAGSQKAQDLVIQLDNGELTNITQAVDDKVGEFAEGDAILVIYKGDTARVIRNKMGQKAAQSNAGGEKAAATN